MSLIHANELGGSGGSGGGVGLRALPPLDKESSASIHDVELVVM